MIFYQILADEKTPSIIAPTNDPVIFTIQNIDNSTENNVNNLTKTTTISHKKNSLICTLSEEHWVEYTTTQTKVDINFMLTVHSSYSKKNTPNNPFLCINLDKLFSDTKWQNKLNTKINIPIFDYIFIILYYGVSPSHKDDFYLYNDSFIANDKNTISKIKSYTTPKFVIGVTYQNNLQILNNNIKSTWKNVLVVHMIDTNTYIGFFSSSLDKVTENISIGLNATFTIDQNKYITQEALLKYYDHYIKIQNTSYDKNTDNTFKQFELQIILECIDIFLLLIRNINLKFLYDIFNLYLTIVSSIPFNIGFQITLVLKAIKTTLVLIFYDTEWILIIKFKDKSNIYECNLQPRFLQQKVFK